jgi:hypothetical protein
MIQVTTVVHVGADCATLIEQTDAIALPDVENTHAGNSRGTRRVKKLAARGGCKDFLCAIDVNGGHW